MRSIAPCWIDGERLPIFTFKYHRLYLAPMLVDLFHRKFEGRNSKGIATLFTNRRVAAHPDFEPRTFVIHDILAVMSELIR